MIKINMKEKQKKELNLKPIKHASHKKNKIREGILSGKRSYYIIK